MKAFLQAGPLPAGLSGRGTACSDRKAFSLQSPAANLFARETYRNLQPRFPHDNTAV